MGEELRSVGIDIDFAPVLDVASNPQNTVIGDRLPSARIRETVSRLGISVAHGLQRTGVIAVGKHFPGHGDTDLDSHFDLPVVRRPARRPRAHGALSLPSRDSGGIDALMTAHGGLHGARPRASRHDVAPDRRRGASRAAALPWRRLLRRSRDEGDLRPLRRRRRRHRRARGRRRLAARLSDAGLRRRTRSTRSNRSGLAKITPGRELWKKPPRGSMRCAGITCAGCVFRTPMRRIPPEGFANHRNLVRWIEERAAVARA